MSEAVQWVNFEAADDNGDGLTLATAKKNLDAAIDTLNAGTSLGGGICFLAGTTPIEVAATPSAPTSAIKFKGMGREAVEVRITANDVTAFPITDTGGRYSSVENVKIRASSDTLTGVKGIHIKAKDVTVREVQLIRIGRDVTAAYEVDDTNAPQSILIESPGGTTIADWLHFANVKIDQCYRGLVCLPGGNGVINGYVATDIRGGCGLYVKRGGTGLNAVFQMSNLHVVSENTGAAVADAGYGYYFDTADTTTPAQSIQATNIRSEGFSPDPQQAHFYINTTYNNFVNVRVNQGNAIAEAGPLADETTLFAALSAQNVTGWVWADGVKRDWSVMDVHATNGL